MKTVAIYILSVLTSIFGVSQAYVEYSKIYPLEYQIIFFDVELGDAILIKTPKGETILIDSSLNGRVAEKVAKYISFFDKTIDLFILSHGDSDHVGGASQIMNQFQVKKILFSGANKKSPEYQEFFHIMQQKKIPYIAIDSKSDFYFNNDLYIDFIYPLKNISYLEDHGNNESLVFLLSIFNKKILFTGDIEEPIEEEILLIGENIKADILKVSHHGSNSSSSINFIKAVNPIYAIAQASLKNKFYHPHKKIVDRYKELGIEFMQTGVKSDIKFCIKKERKEFFICE